MPIVQAHPSDEPAATAAGGCSTPEAGFAFEALKPFTRFTDVLETSVFVRVPDDWWIGRCDVVDSTGAIAAGRYRQVNIAGAAAIAAVRNALHGRTFAFVFGGDGASLVLPPSDRSAVETALSATVTFVREELGLTLRAALVPVRAVRETGLDLRVARYAASESVAYAMFEGGGLAFADTQTKAGAYAVPAAPAGSRLDLTGLSCRFEPVPAPMGLILSVLAIPLDRADHVSIRAALADILGLIEAGPRMGRPLPGEGPPLSWPPSGWAIEARLRGPLLGSRVLRKAQILIRTGLSLAIFRSGLTLGRFSPRRYLREVVANTDFRKFDDGLRMTVACDAATADTIEARLRAARAAGLLRYGLHRQGAAILTCITPSAVAADHVHFVDGAGGGYALAARQLKAGDP
jgi:hypothetical protein